MMNQTKLLHNQLWRCVFKNPINAPIGIIQISHRFIVCAYNSIIHNQRYSIILKQLDIRTQTWSPLDILKFIDNDSEQPNGINIFFHAKTNCIVILIPQIGICNIWLYNLSTKTLNKKCINLYYNDFCTTSFWGLCTLARNAVHWFNFQPNNHTCFNIYGAEIGKFHQSLKFAFKSSKISQILGNSFYSADTHSIYVFAKGKGQLELHKYQIQSNEWQKQCCIQYDNPVLEYCDVACDKLQKNMFFLRFGYNILIFNKTTETLIASQIKIPFPIARYIVIYGSERDRYLVFGYIRQLFHEGSITISQSLQNIICECLTQEWLYLIGHSGELQYIQLDSIINNVL